MIGVPVEPPAARSSCKEALRPEVALKVAVGEAEALVAEADIRAADPC